MKILFVDDDKVMRRMLSRILTREGHDVTTACNGMEALALLAYVPFDLLITDQKMPGLTGEQLIAELRKTSDMPVIWTTGFARLPEFSEKALAFRSVWLLDKPFHTVQLTQIICQLMDAKAATS